MTFTRDQLNDQPQHEMFRDWLNECASMVDPVERVYELLDLYREIGPLDPTDDDLTEDQLDVLDYLRQDIYAAIQTADRQNGVELR